MTRPVPRPVKLECDGHGDCRPATIQDELNSALNRIDALHYQLQALRSQVGLLESDRNLLLDRLETWGDNYGEGFKK